MLNLHQKKDTLYCDKCGKQSATKESLKVHIQNIHLKIGQKNFQCENCPQAFRSTTTLQIHIARHGSERQFVCLICQNGYKTDVDLNSHKRRMHNAIDQYKHKCKYCFKLFFEKAKLSRHEEVFHIKSGKFTCNYCSAMFGAQHDLNRHIKIHSGQKDYNCTACEKSFVQKTTLNVHMRTVHYKLKPFQCEHCQKSFGQYGDLTRHINKQHGLITK
jgi:uncharacterized Zn-finger protein